MKSLFWNAVKASSLQSLAVLLIGLSCPLVWGSASSRHRAVCVRGAPAAAPLPEHNSNADVHAGWLPL